ncbi:MAG: hypothetical protein L0226_11090 [Acidobacteria bacterium]|nr:hypothetical protein [Acidobacteriota bacterium]
MYNHRGLADDRVRRMWKLNSTPEELKDNFDGRIITIMSQSGLADPKEVSHRVTLLGTIAYYQASGPA